MRSHAKQAKAPSAGSSRRRGSTRARTAALMLCALLVLALSLGAVSALASHQVLTWFGTETLTGTLGGQFNNPRDVAVNEIQVPAGPYDGNTYVVDEANNRIQRFDKDGNFISAWGADVEGSTSGGTNFEICTIAASCKAGTASGGNGTTAGNGTLNLPQAVAVDQDTGNVYVSDRNNRRINAYDGEGNFIRSFGFAVDTTLAGTGYEVCPAADVCGAGTGGAGVGQYGNGATGGTHLFDVAVSPPDGNPATGKLFLANTGNRRVETYELDGTAPASFGTSANFELNQPRKIAVDSRGIVYASNSKNFGEIERYDSAGVNGPAGSFLAPITGQNAAPTGPLLAVTAGTAGSATAGLEVSPDSDGAGTDTDVLYVLRDPTEGATVVQQFGPLNKPGQSTAPLAADDQHGAAANFAAVFGLGLNDAEGRLLIAANFGGGHRVWMLGSPPQPPVVTIVSPVSATGTTASFEGTVKTDKLAAGYHFEYSQNGTTWIKVPAVDVTLPGDSATHPVSAAVEGLTAHTTYQVKVVATKALGGGSSSAETTFETSGSPPLITATSHSQLTDTSALLEGAVNPEKEATKYRFEYLTEEAWEENGESFEGPNAPSKAPSSPVAIGSGAVAVAVAQKVSGLHPATAYRYRLTATNGTGSESGEVERFTTYSSPEVFSGCANEALRTGDGAALPDCRAYEQASPVDKNGSSLQGIANQTLVASPDGSAISFENPAGVPGGVGAQNFPTYVAKRGGGTWSTFGLLPDSTVGPDANVLGWTPDFSLAFGRGGSSIIGDGLYGRSTTGDPLTELVPHTLPKPIYSYVGASEDASTVLFGAGPTNFNNTTLKLTPEAAAGKPNLYAWDRDTGEIRLAGVLPDGSTPAQGSEAGPAGEGTNTYNQDTHAVSEDGSVFFTDLNSEGQLYLRLNPTEPETPNKDPDTGDCIPDPVLACTVHISATQKTNGKGPEVPGGGHRDAAGPQPAVLHFASPDGSVAIFSSSEKLTDDANTGPEPDAPSIAKAKASDGSEKNVDFLPVFADQIDVDETAGYVYWTDPSHERIGRAKLDGSEAPEENLITGLHNLKGVAVVDEPGTAEHVFWTSPADGEAEGTSPTKGNGTIGRAELDGDNPEPSCLEGITNPRSIDADDEHVYWTAPVATSSTGEGDLGRAALDCEETSKELEFIKDHTAISGDVVVNETHIYTSSYGSQTHSSSVNRFTLDGTQDGFGIAFVSDTNSAIGLAVGGSHLYWTDPDHNKVSRANLDGSSPEANFIPEAGRPSDPALDATNVYWAANQGVNANPGNDLYSLDRESGELSDLAVDSTHPNGMEVRGVLGASQDGDYVYFAANGVPDELTGSPNPNGEEVAPGNCEGVVGLGAKGTCNLYLAHGGEVTFIARLTIDQLGAEFASGDGLNWVGGYDNLEFGKQGKSARVSEDGQTLLFRSQRQLTAYDNQGSKCVPEGLNPPKPGPCLELYLYRVGEGIVCVTCVPTGAAPTQPMRLSSLTSPNQEATPPAALLMRNLSSDGQRVFFESPDQLVAADTNGYDGCPPWGAPKQQSSRACQDVYEWEAPGKGSCTEASGAYSPQNDGCIYLLSTGKSEEASFFADASKDGDDVFIFTYERLVPQDEDDLLDVYDARVDGGLASQHQVAAVTCEGEGCKGPASAAPSSSSPGSPSFAGPGNQSTRRKPPSRRCPKGARKVRRQGKARCVKRARQHKRAANTNRRAGR